MKRVTGIGGIFFKAQDPKALGAWYKKHLGIDVEDWGGFGFRWNSPTTLRAWAAPSGAHLPQTAATLRPARRPS
ncbi:VOC family protein [Ideonella paludis]|uniref:VOC family protein n=1 Tax=Ideonella paludis TaxID=1233411 RepID=UPI00362CE7FB